MERLTERVYGYTQLKACGNDFCKETCAEHDDERSCDNCPIQKAIEKLAKYEDLEEQGLLLKFPCKVGSEVYSIRKGLTYGEIGDKPTEWSRIDRLKFNIDMVNDFGKTVFLMQAEAEEALQRMERGE